MGYFGRRWKPGLFDLNQPVDWDAAKRAAACVNAGDVEGADRICQATVDPRQTAFAAFRYIDPAD